MLSLLREKNFRLLWLGQIFSQFGDRMLQLILVALAAAAEPGSSLILAKVMTLTSLPALVMGPFAGAYVDRWDRKRTMILCDLIRVAAILSLPAMAVPGRRIPLYLDIFLIFAVGSFFLPARLAIIPPLVPEDRLGKANAMFTASGMIGSALSLLIGALLVEWVGTTRGCWINAAGYAMSAIFILGIRHATQRRGTRERPSTRFLLAEVWEGLRELWKHRMTRRVVGLLGLLLFGAGASFVVATVLVQRWLGTVTKDLGFLSFWCGIGMFLGTAAYGRWAARRSKRWVLGFSFLGAGLALGLFLGAVVVLKSGAAASIAAVLLGMCVSPAGLVANTLVHEAHPERFHGRMFSSLGLVVNLSLIGSMLGAGWVGQIFGQERLLGVIGALFALAGSALLYYSSWETQRSPLPRRILNPKS